MGMVEMLEHRAGQLHFMELQTTQMRQPLKTRETRFGQTLQPRRWIHWVLGVVHASQESQLFDCTEIRERSERGVAQRLIHVDDPVHLTEVLVAQMVA